VAEETPAAAPESAPEKPKQSNFMLILIVVVVSLGSSLGGAFLTSHMIGKALAALPVAGVAEAKESEEDATVAAIEHGAVVPLDPFVVNLADKEAARYLRIKISLMVDDKAKVAEITENEALTLKVRDIILQTLTKKTAQELMDEEGKNKLREEIHQGIDRYFKEPKLTDVMFTEFVIQL